MESLQRSRIVGLSALTLTTLFVLGAGCAPSQGPRTTTVNGNTTTANVTVTAPEEPTGTSTEDAATVEDTLNQMESAQTAAEDAATEVDNGEDVDSYTLPTSIPE